jgi:hypothetical protein
MTDFNLNESIRKILEDSLDEEELESFRRKNEKSTFFIYFNSYK